MSKRSHKRSRPIATKIVSLLLVPLISLVGLWVFAAATTSTDVRALLNGRTLGDFAFTGEELVVALQDERRASLIYVGQESRGDATQMEALRQRTDVAVATFRREAADEGIRSLTNEDTDWWVDEALRRLERLDNIRDRIDANQAKVVPTTETYAEMILPLARMPAAMSADLGHKQISAEARTLGRMLVAREILYREFSLLSGALADDRLSAAEYTKFVQLAGTARYVYAQVFPQMRSEDQERYRQITSTSAYNRVQTMESQIINSGGNGKNLPVSATEWRNAATQVMDDLIAMGKASGEGTIERILPVALRVVLRFATAGLVGLIAVIVSIILSVRIGRSVVRDLTGLRQAAQELADERLPRVVERLHRGGPDEDVEEDTKARLPQFETQEIGQVGEAFSAVQRTAVNEAVNEARMRAGVRKVFVNLARRSQTLLNRQLKMLDEVERRTEEPDALEDLFRLDHLATRMQRHAEGLIIISGNAPGRRWRDPVPMIDVVRAAVAEVEGYSRVEVLPVTPHQVRLAGPVVADVVHLLAELIENATLFSPPNTEVQVHPQLVSNGFVVEIEDRGLGLGAEEMAAANDRLANPPEFDLAESARLGLFVVGQLAKRHGIRVLLRGSPYGGVTAIVLLPPSLIVEASPSVGTDNGEATTGAPAGPSGGAGQPGHSGPPDPRSEPAGVAGTSSTPGTADQTGNAGLPQRVRQASLSPQLRKDSGNG